MTEYNKNDFIESDNKKIEQVLKMLNEMGVTIQPANYSGSNKTPVLGLYTPDGNSIADIGEISTNMEVLEDVIVELQSKPAPVTVAPSLTVPLADNAAGTAGVNNGQYAMGGHRHPLAIPINHAITGSTHGLGSATLNGHLRLSDSVTLNSGTTSGIAATPNAVRNAGMHGNFNVILGSTTPHGNIINPTGSGNTAINGMSNIANGNQNTAIGSAALNEITSGMWNTGIGAQALLSRQDGTNNRDSSHCTGVGYSTRVSGNNQVQIGFNETVFSSSAIAVRSDERDKTNIQSLTYDPLDFINAIQPRQYIYDHRERYEQKLAYPIEYIQKLPKSEQEKYWKETKLFESRDAKIITEEEFHTLPHDEQELFLRKTEKVKLTEKVFYVKQERGEFYVTINQFKSDGSQAGKRLHNGFIAQQVREVADAMGFDFAGHHDHTVNGGCDVHTLAYQEFIAPMVASIQELTKQNKMMMSILEKNDLI